MQPRAKRVVVLVAIGTLFSTMLTPAFSYERPGDTELISISSTGAQGDPCKYVEGVKVCPWVSPAPWGPSISYDGGFVAFDSEANGLVDGDDNLLSDVFVRDRGRSSTVRVSVASNGAEAVGPPNFNRGYAQPGRDGLLSYDPSISKDGRFVAFTSHAVNLVSGDTNASTDVFVHDRVSGDTERVSVSSTGAQGMILCPTCSPLLAMPDSYYPSISANGRFVSFTSAADNLVPDDTNGRLDIFVHDRTTGKTERVSVRSDGSQSSMVCGELLCRNNTGFVGASNWEPRSSISGDGRFVAFDSDATDLVDGDTNDMADVFVHDRKSGKTERVSVDSNGAEGVDHRPYLEQWLSGSGLGNDPYGSSNQRTISHDGRFVVFYSTAINLVPNDTDTNALPFTATHREGVDVFVHDRKTGRTERVSVAPTGGQAGFRDLPSEYVGLASFIHPSISPDGRFVSFTSDQSQNFSGNPQNNSGIFVHDRATGDTRYVSYRAGQDNDAFWGVQTVSEVSNGGRYVVFSSLGNHSSGTDENPSQDIFLRSMGRALDTVLTKRSTSAVDRSSDPLGDVSLHMGASGADLLGARVAYRPQRRDFFVADELARMSALAHESRLSHLPILFGVDLTVGGQSYEARAQISPAGTSETGGAVFGLFRCEGGATCTRVADLEGGYGTTGEEVVFTLPLESLGVTEASDVVVVGVWSALGTYLSPSYRILDRVTF